MKASIRTSLKHFFRFEILLLIIALILIFVGGCFTWQTFYRTPNEKTMRRDFLVMELGRQTPLSQKALAEYSPLELEIISRLGFNGVLGLQQNNAAFLRVYEELQDFQLFYDVVTEFGPHHVIPVLDYFYNEGNLALTLDAEIKKLFQRTNADSTRHILSPRQQRLLAVLGEIDYQQHQFLARFAYMDNGAYRNYVATVTSSLVNFFTSGLSHLNATIVTRGIAEVSTAELVDAGIDILVLVPLAAWLTRGGRVTGVAARSSMQTAARSSRVVKLTGATRGFWRVVPVRTLFSLKAVKWYALALVIYKPDLLNHAAALVAETISVPPIALKTGFWLLLLFPFLNVIAGLFWGIRRILRSVLSLKKTQPA